MVGLGCLTIEGHSVPAPSSSPRPVGPGLRSGRHGLMKMNENGCCTLEYCCSASVRPAYAGVVPHWQKPSETTGCPSRICGGCPTLIADGVGVGMSDPHMRGLSQWDDEISKIKKVRPAYAGVVPASSPTSSKHYSPSRICGGCPLCELAGATLELSVPHMRGLSSWTPLDAAKGAVRPAYAGVVPASRCLRSSSICPSRIRGGCPPEVLTLLFGEESVPHTRGLSAALAHFLNLEGVRPAYAGVVRHRRGHGHAPVGPSRIRGGCPFR